MSLLLVATTLATCPVSLPQQTFAQTRRLVPENAMHAADEDRTVGLVGDLDGDGSADVLYVTPGADLLLYGSAATEFTDGSADLPDFGPDNSAAALGDLNGDGALDAVVGSRLAPTGVFASSGGVLTPHATLGAGAEETSDLALADLDGDGDLDLVTASTGPSVTPETEVWRNDGGAGFSLVAGAVPASTFVPTVALALADFDGDGSVDLYLSQPAATDRLLLGSPSAVFQEAASSPLAERSWEVAAGDPNGDGNADVCILGSGGKVLLGAGDGAGALAFGWIDEYAGTDVAIAIVDVDLDGLDDVVLAEEFHPKVARSLGAGAFVVEELTSYAHGIGAVGDLDGDQDVDVLIQGAIPGLMLHGAGEYHDVLHHFGFRVDLGGVVEVGDVDGNGADDLVATNQVLLSDGKGRLTQKPAMPFVALDHALSDLEGDGDLDVIAATQEPVVLGVNDGTGAFASGGAVASLEKIWRVESADVDGDGDDDLLAARAFIVSFLSGLPLAELRLNDGAGDLATLAQDDFVDEMSDARFVDLDLDGDLDLLVAGAVSAAHRNDGSGAFAPSTLVPPGLGAAYVTAGDVDSDGDPDAVFARAAGDLLLVNDGTGALLPAALGQLPAAAGQSGRPVLDDGDGDGDLDLFVVGKQHLYYEGGGAGTFAAPHVIATHEGAAPTAAVLDVDLDGDLDVVGGGLLSVGAWIRVDGGQTARRTPPRIGKPLVMQTYGAPGDTYLLAVAPFPASIPLGAYGTLWLDPATVKLVASGAIPADGRATDLLAVPNVAPLVGETVYWQSFVGSPGAFTGSESMLLTAD